jgi:hypothetical protein
LDSLCGRYLVPGDLVIVVPSDCSAREGAGTTTTTLAPVRARGVGVTERDE